jgi:hypothetical protein
MRDIRAEILGLLQAGPVTRRKLLHGRSGMFKLAYRSMCKDGTIREGCHPMEHSWRTPIWVYLPEQSIPAPRIHRARMVDVRLLMRHTGWTRQEAVRAIYACPDYYALVRLLSWARTQLNPHPVDQRKPGRPRKELARSVAELSD